MSLDALNDLNSGAIDYMMTDLGFALSLHRAGKLRVLAVTSKERMTTAPDIPTMDESGVPGVDITGWWGIEVPAGVPQPIKDKISSAFLKMAEKPETKKWLTDLSYDPWVIGPAEAQAQMIKDIKKWAEWVKLANLQPKG
jgi:tripartite-type tricarboxylate transporter receptor subunit TctC